MAARLFRSAVAVGVLSVAACNGERKEECGKFLAAMKPLDQGTPSAETVDRVASEVGAIQFQDQPLGMLAKNYRVMLTVLSSTLKSARDGNGDVVTAKLKEACAQGDDATEYCSQFGVL